MHSGPNLILFQLFQKEIYVVPNFDSKIFTIGIHKFLMVKLLLIFEKHLAPYWSVLCFDWM